MKYLLKHPITIGSEQITELNIRERLVAGDMRGIPMRDPMYFDDMLKIISRLTGQTDVVINAMHIEDLEGVAKALEGFLPAGLGTGNGPSQ